MNLKYCLGGIVGALLMAGILRLVHVYKRQHQMRCSHCDGVWCVKKEYQMIHIEGNFWEMYVFGVCECGEVRLIRTENKEFTRSQIDRREDKFPEQFIYKEELFRKAGLITGTDRIFGVHLSQITSRHQNRLRDVPVSTE